MSFYLRDFDKPLSENSLTEFVSLKDQLIYAILTEPSVFISAASPFKNRAGWETLQKYCIFLASGIIKFPLDKYYQGSVNRYILSRIEKIEATSDNSGTNPELISYKSSNADQILKQIDYSIYIKPRRYDCDQLFRNLVITDIQSEESQTIKGILYSKRMGWGKDDFLDYIQETAINNKKLFQRFDIIDHAPKSFIIDRVLRDHLYRRLDELYFQANAQAVNDHESSESTCFTHTSAARLRSFAMGYKIQNVSLHQHLLSLTPEQLLVIRESPELERFLTFLSHYSLTTSRYLLEEQAHQMAMNDKISCYIQRIINSTIRVGTSKLLGRILSETLQLPHGIPTNIVSVLIGFFNQLSVKLKKMDAQKFYDFVLNYSNKSE